MPPQVVRTQCYEIFTAGMNPCKMTQHASKSAPSSAFRFQHPNHNLGRKSTSNEDTWPSVLLNHSSLAFFRCCIAQPFEGEKGGPTNPGGKPPTEPQTLGPPNPAEQEGSGAGLK